jgi:hypothetical protein
MGTILSRSENIFSSTHYDNLTVSGTVEVGNPCDIPKEGGCFTFNASLKYAGIYKHGETAIFKFEAFYNKEKENIVASALHTTGGKITLNVSRQGDSNTFSGIYELSLPYDKGTIVCTLN